MITPARLQQAQQLRNQGLTPAVIRKAQSGQPIDRMPAYWANIATRVDPTNNPYFGTGFDGYAPFTLGSGNGFGFYSGLPEQFQQNPQADSGNPGRIDPQALSSWLTETNQELMEANVEGRAVRWLQNPTGKITGKIDVIDTTDAAFGGFSQLVGNMIATAIGGPAGAAAFNAVNGAGNTAVAGGDLSDILKSAAVSGGTAYLGGKVASGAGLTGTPAAATSGAVQAGANTAILGGSLSDVLKNAAIGGATSGAGAWAGGTLNPALRAPVAQLVGSALRGQPVNNRQLMAQLLIGMMRQPPRRQG